MLHKCRGMKNDTEVKNLRNGGRPESRSYIGSGISRVTSEVLLGERYNVSSIHISQSILLPEYTFINGILCLDHTFASLFYA